VIYSEDKDILLFKALKSIRSKNSKDFLLFLSECTTWNLYKALLKYKSIKFS